MDKIKVALEKKIKTYRLLLVIIGCTMSGIRIFFVFDILPENNVQNFMTGSIDGFFIGFNLALLLSLLFLIFKIKKSMKDEKMMKKYYTFINDERNILIKTKSGMPVNIVNSYLMVLASYLFQGINIYISFTCLAIAILMIFQLFILKLYYMKTM